VYDTIVTRNIPVIQVIELNLHPSQPLSIKCPAHHNDDAPFFENIV
jgi:hypothetical protein